MKVAETKDNRLGSGADSTMTAYQHGREHLTDELATLDARLHLQVLKFRERHAYAKGDEFAGMYISEEKIDRVIKESVREQEASDSSISMQTQRKRIENIETRIQERVQASLDMGILLPLYHLAYLFHLSPFEMKALLLCLAPELDLKYEIIYAYLQDDVTQKSPTLNLILDLLCDTREERLNARALFCSQAPLLKHGLLKFVEEGSEKPLISKTLKLDDRIVNFLLDFNLHDARLEGVAQLLYPEKDWADVVMDDTLKEQLKHVWREHFSAEEQQNPLIFSFYGPSGAGKKLAAEALCHNIQLPLLITDTKALLHRADRVEETIKTLFREALLQPAAIYLEHADMLFSENSQFHHVQQLLLKELEESSLVTFLSGEKPWMSPAHINHQIFFQIEWPLPVASHRKELWERSVNGRHSLTSDVALFADIDTDVLANTFKLTGGQIRNALNEARNLAKMQSSGNNGHITMEALYQGCRAQSNRKLGELAQKITPHYVWDDIVLPPDKLQQLKEMCAYVKHRQRVYGEWGFDRKLSLGKGLNALFSGPSGTGKTMAADVIANELKLELYKIDLSCVVSKYIGETEKNLSKIFKEAETGNAILFFDEADALFGKRSEVKDAHDRYANIEIGYLLQKMEEYDGIVILATNLRSNMDEAFVRRLQFNVEFPFPDEEYRERIWHIIFPGEAPKSDDINFDFLAQNFNITGGNIKNIVLTAAFLAAENSGVIQMKHLIRATKRELQKMGKLCIKSNFGKYYQWIAPV